jgi:hypothetical protein
MKLSKRKVLSAVSYLLNIYYIISSVILIIAIIYCDSVLSMKNCDAWLWAYASVVAVLNLGICLGIFVFRETLGSGRKVSETDDDDDDEYLFI